MFSSRMLQTRPNERNFNMSDKGECSGTAEASAKKLVQDEVRPSVKEVFESVFKKKRKTTDVSGDEYWCPDDDEDPGEKRRGGLSATKRRGRHEGVLCGTNEIQAKPEEIGDTRGGQ
ncbi:hypothetical protein NDU88_001092 [Pleurodeles waltl]|uniref:Uncharacterized protein n=1 Tax=Pleurodeles waltl TaxID=8319 RepID=A0AAV7U8C0_PLEWA|nr:hypothetical protein NDU88_001092 [Pleurodeles waltl]